MSIALQLFLTVVLPVLLILAVGVLIDRRKRLDIATLSALNFHVFVPALVFAKLSTSDLSPEQSGRIAMFVIVQALAMGGLALLLTAWRPLRQHRAVLMLGAMFHNAGNYGIPFVLLAFGESLIGPAIVVLVAQNLLNFTAGVLIIDSETRGIRRTMLGFAKIPVIWACVLAVAVRAAGTLPPEALMLALRYLGDGLVPVALLTLGAQLSRSMGFAELAPASIGSVLRLLVSPALALALCPLFGFTGDLRAMLVATSGLPVAVNVFILAAEYRRGVVAASQMVFWSTVLSCLTLVALLAMLR
jgi:predicted permease